MFNVKAFVEGKQHLNTIDSQRLAVGNRYRVAVPPTRLKRTVPNSPEQRPKTSPFPGGASTLKQGPVGGQETTGFDTDAESLEDTTTMSVSVSAKDNLNPQAVRFLSSSEASSCNTDTEHRRILDSFEGEKCSTRPAQRTNASAFSDGCLSESEVDDNQDFQVLVTNDFESEEFANFRKNNVLKNEFLQDFQYPLEPAAEHGMVASSDPQAHEQHSVGRSTAKALSPTRHHAVIVKPQSNDMPNLENPIRMAKCLQIGDMERAPSKRLANQFRVPLASLELSRQLSNRALQPSVQYAEANMGADHTAAKSETVVERPVHGRTSNIQTPSVRHRYNDSIAELCEDENMEKVAQCKVDQERLKRSRSLDHDPDRLAAMTFQQLRDECFDSAPKSGISTIAPEFSGAFLRAKLENVCIITDPADRDDQQQALFDSLTIEQYGESGELIGQKLGEIIAKLSGIRYQKRKVASEYELAIAKREHIVRNKTAALRKEKVLMTRQTEELTTGLPP